MKPKDCGWQDGGRFFRTRAGIVEVDNVKRFNVLVDIAIAEVKDKIRPGRITTKGNAASDSIWSHWIEDYINHMMYGDYAPLGVIRVTQAHISAIAEKLGWKQRWRSGIPEYCVLKRDLWTLDQELKRGRIS